MGGRTDKQNPVFFQYHQKTVWTLLTDKDQLVFWFDPAGVDLNVSERYALTRKAYDGLTVKKIEEPAPSAILSKFL